jgi:Fe-Mn family superoxide dismutase
MSPQRLHDPSRRDFLESFAAVAASASLSRVDASAFDSEESKGVISMPASIPAFAPVHQPKGLSFDPAKLEGLSEKLIRSHWENNYGGSVKTLNAVKQRLAAALADKDTPPFVYDDLKREHLMRTGSVVFHELYFDNLGGSGPADAYVRKAIGASFGDFTNWETEFRKIGAGLGGGSGWVVAGHNLHTGQIENYWLADHLHSPAATAPILVMDMYEHSYQMDYGASATSYIDAFFRNVRWEVVADRLKRASAWRAAQS